MPYTSEKIKEKVREALITNPATVYKRGFVNNKGCADGERYTEIIARELWRDIKSDDHELFQNIPKITREKSYKTKSHEKLAEREKPKKSNRDEEWIAIGMYGKTFDCIGKILDFQTPLKNNADDDAGKIDLLSYNADENAAYILELKKPESDETLLRCALEAYTYWKIVDKEKLLCDFGIKGADLRKAVLVFKNCVAYKDFIGDECDSVKDFMTNILHVDLFVLNDEISNVIKEYKLQQGKA
jgi:hypothetical protein